jgi:cell division septation protein DedD
MSRDRIPGQRDDEPEMEEYEDDGPRSIFAALWFRALLAVLILGVLAAIAVPYVLDFATRSASDSSGAKRTASAPPPAAVPPAATPPTARPAAPPPPTASTPAPAPGLPAAAPQATAPTPTAVTPPAPPSTPPKASTSAPATVQPSRVTATFPPTKSVAKNVDAPKEAARTPSASKPAAAKAASGATAGGAYWVQVGAFKDPETAKRVAARLREQGFPAEQSATSGKGGAAAAPAESAGDRYSVIVSGGSPGDVDAKLAAKGMTSEATPGGAVVQPSLRLRDAVALSRELADAGLTVQVRRQGGPAPSAPAPARTSETWHRVRVGGFPDRATAMASLKKLEEKGYKPFIATGTE